MASTLSLSLYLSLSTNPHQNKPVLFSRTPKTHRQSLKPFSFPSSSSSSQSSTKTDTEPLVVSYVCDPLRAGRFLSSEELEKLKLLDGFCYRTELESGSLSIRAMREDETDSTVALLAESFAESMVLPKAYNSLLKFLVKHYLVERRDAIPHAITLLGFFRERGDFDEGNLAGTVEVCFDKRGANASPPTPTAPIDSPYISNMTVKEDLRRRGIGWHLLKAAEELISKMSFASEVYLHCRMIDTAPFNMYQKAGYHVVKTDNLFILLMLQRRKHLMRKKLPVKISPSESNDLGFEEGLT